LKEQNITTLLVDALDCLVVKHVYRKQEVYIEFPFGTIVFLLIKILCCMGFRALFESIQVNFKLWFLNIIEIFYIFNMWKLFLMFYCKHTSGEIHPVCNLTCCKVNATIPLTHWDVAQC